MPGEQERLSRLETLQSMLYKTIKVGTTADSWVLLQ